MFKLIEVSKEYRISHVESFFALKNVSLQINKGEITMIVGKSGSGKTTLLNVLSGLDKPTKGNVIFENQDLWEISEKDRERLRNQSFGFVFQTFFLEPNYTVYQNVLLPLLATKSSKKENHQKIISCLKSLSLSDKINIPAKKLSGGEQQRVAIARAIINNPQVIFANEPTGNLDSKNAQEIINILLDFKRQGKTIIMVTHDESYLQYADRIIKLKDGEVVA